MNDRELLALMAAILASTMPSRGRTASVAVGEAALLLRCVDGLLGCRPEQPDAEPFLEMERRTRG